MRKFLEGKDSEPVTVGDFYLLPSYFSSTSLDDGIMIKYLRRGPNGQKHVICYGANIFSLIYVFLTLFLLSYHCYKLYQYDDRPKE